MLLPDAGQAAKLWELRVGEVTTPTLYFYIVLHEVANSFYLQVNACTKAIIDRSTKNRITVHAT